MGKDSKSKEAKGKGKQAGGGNDESASKGTGKAGKGDGLGTCTFVKGTSYVRSGGRSMKHKRNCEMVGLAMIAQEYSECPSGKKGGDLGWFPRGKMAGSFQEVAFNTVIGATSAPFKSTFIQLTFSNFLGSDYYLVIWLFILQTWVPYHLVRRKKELMDVNIGGVAFVRFDIWVVPFLDK
ncbi:hypothetical protein CRYUN_Cryun12cG0153200 [Craigia yunnanensis]